jgi:hypothetical protein
MGSPKSIDRSIVPLASTKNAKKIKFSTHEKQRKTKYLCKSKKNHYFS